MKITVLDADTLGKDLTLAPLEEIGTCAIYPNTSAEEVAPRIADTDVIVVNKIKLNGTNLSQANNLKLICVTATGYDNIDTAYCRDNDIAVCNVADYSSNSVAQLTAAMVLSLSVHLTAYTEFVKDGSYSASGVANRLSPVYHELSGKTWGIVGLGNIGKKVSKIAEALGCRVIVCKRTPEKGYTCTDIDTLCQKADIISLHTPLSDSTRNLINKERIAAMKKTVILVNVARGAVLDEAAAADAIKEGRLGGFGCDVYTKEPMEANHPYTEIMDFPNVCLTPHMAWGAYEARCRCLEEVAANIKAFFAGEIRNRVD